eukprot:225964_1
MSKPNHNQKKRKYGDKWSRGPSNKKRRFDHSQKPRNKLSPEESKAKCLNITKTLQAELQSASMDLMTWTQFTESDVGIKTFLDDSSTSHAPIIANLKHKYEDFIVSEIDESGNTVQLTNSDPIRDADSIDKDATLSDSITKVNEHLSSLIDPQTAQRFTHWYTNAIKQKHNIDVEMKDHQNDIDTDTKPIVKEEDNKAITSFVFSANKDKAERTTLHKLLKQLQYISAKTNDSSCVEVQVARHKFAKQRWPRTRGAYLKFALTKIGMDTTHCLSAINNHLHRTTKTFNISGTKDKHAITSQMVTAYHVTSDELKNAVSRMKNVEVGNFEYVSQQLRLGALQGNTFKIALRNVQYETDQKSDVQETELHERVEILKSIGFINYYGMQRFGASTVGTHHIGRAIVSGNLRLAAALLVLPRAGESEQFAKERAEFMNTGDIMSFPRKLYTEKKCIYGLLEDANNYQQAFMKIPRNMRTMYAHSYQSYIWNHCVSERIDKYGYAPVVGDLVRIQKDIESDQVQGERRDINQDFEYVTKDNLDKYSIFDVVFPLPSPNIMLPKLEPLLEFMGNLLNKDDLTLDSFDRMNGGDWGVNTNYRNIMAKPLDVEACVKEYQSNEELLMDVPFKLDSQMIKNEQEDDSKKIGWIISFGLPKSSYATMCIRQLLFIASDKLKR